MMNIKNTYIITATAVCLFISLSTRLHAQVTFGSEDDSFLWGVSGGVVLPGGTPSDVFSFVKLQPGYTFAVDFRHRLGYDGPYSKYFAFIHYGFRLGSFFYSTEKLSIDNNATTYDDYIKLLATYQRLEEEKTYIDETNPQFFHFDIPLGMEFPLIYCCQNTFSINVLTELVGRFYISEPNNLFNLAAVGGLAMRYEKFQIQASYSYFMLEQFKYAPNSKKWRIYEITAGLKFYF